MTEEEATKALKDKNLGIKVDSEKILRSMRKEQSVSRRQKPEQR